VKAEDFLKALIIRVEDLVPLVGMDVEGELIRFWTTRHQVQQNWQCVISRAEDWFIRD